MTLVQSESLFVAITFHKWTKPNVWSVVIPFDWKETMICFGFGTLHWERNIG